ncbi:MAG: 8-oxo-dGTP diphosphatase MutT [Hyphomicrobiales bacterium]
MIDVTAAIWVENGKVLIARRRPGVSQAGLWEFPGGKVRPGETPEQCLRREIQEELGLEIAVGKFFGESIHAYEDKTIRLLAYRVSAKNGEVSLNDHAEMAWVTVADLGGYRFCPADIPLVDKLQCIS